MAAIELVGRQMCEECDAFLGKAHKDTCSKSGRAVIEADCTEKFTTVEHAERENPLVGIDVEGAEFLVGLIGKLDISALGADEYEKAKGFRGGLETFIAAVREIEAGGD